MIVINKYSNSDKQMWGGGCFERDTALKTGQPACAFWERTGEYGLVFDTKNNMF